MNLHLLNGYAGAFTEFVSFHSCRFHRGLSNILMESNGGDSSFHGVGFHEIQCQIKVSGNPGDGGTNTDAGVGLELRGNANSVTWYNGFCYIHLFGGVGATAIKLTEPTPITSWGSLLAKVKLFFRVMEAPLNVGAVSITWVIPLTMWLQNR
ncbi:hypothetical protein IC615_12260 [Serratia ureilytica]